VVKWLPVAAWECLGEVVAGGFLGFAWVVKWLPVAAWRCLG